MNKTRIDHATTELIFFDDFSSPELDPSRWNIRITGPIVNNEQQAYIDSSDAVYIEQQPGSETPTSGGILTIQAIYRENFTSPSGTKFDFLSGRIDTKDRFDFQHGTVSARIKLPAGDGLWPAFWAIGYGEWPENGEFDIMENVGATDWISAGIHGPGYSGEDGLINQVYFSGADNSQNWHVYSAVWEPGHFLFYVDGKLFYRVTKEMADFFGPWVFNNPKYLVLNLAIGGIYPFKINGVKAPYYGVPASTLRTIQNNQARMLIDWVKVIKHD